MVIIVIVNLWIDVRLIEANSVRVRVTSDSVRLILKQERVFKTLIVKVTV